MATCLTFCIPIVFLPTKNKPGNLDLKNPRELKQKDFVAKYRTYLISNSTKGFFYLLSFSVPTLDTQKNEEGTQKKLRIRQPMDMGLISFHLSGTGCVRYSGLGMVFTFVVTPLIFK